MRTNGHLKETTRTSVEYIKPCDCTLKLGLQTFNIKPLHLQSVGKKCGSVPAPHNFQFRGNLHFN